jgi:hypothetical protein
MQTNTVRKLENQILEDPLTAEITRELEADHARELRRLSDLAFVFLSATDGDRAQAEELLDNAIDLLLEGGVLSTLGVTESSSPRFGRGYKEMARQRYPSDGVGR